MFLYEMDVEAYTLRTV